MVERGIVEYDDSENFEVEAVLDMVIQEDEVNPLDCFSLCVQPAPVATNNEVKSFSHAEMQGGNCG